MKADEWCTCPHDMFLNCRDADGQLSLHAVCILSLSIGADTKRLCVRACLRSNDVTEGLNPGVSRRIALPDLDMKTGAGEWG